MQIKRAGSARRRRTTRTRTLERRRADVAARQRPHFARRHLEMLALSHDITVRPSPLSLQSHQRRSQLLVQSCNDRETLFFRHEYTATAVRSSL